MKRRIFRVLLAHFPYTKRWKLVSDTGGGWYFDTQKEAIRAAQEKISAQIVIHGRNGRIQSERTYGLDPRRSKG